MDVTAMSVFDGNRLAGASLRFLSAFIRANEGKPAQEVYAEMLRQVEGCSTALLSAVPAVLGAYTSLVLPDGILFEDFSKALLGRHKLNWTGFVWTEPAKYGPDPTVTDPTAARSDCQALGGIRNALACGNFELEFPTDDPLATSLYLWSRQDRDFPEMRYVRMSVASLDGFAMRVHGLFRGWHEEENLRCSLQTASRREGHGKLSLHSHNGPKSNFAGGETTNEQREQCIHECLDCHRLCLQEAMNHCLEAGGQDVAPPHFRLMVNCAEMCQTCANFMLSGSPLHKLTCCVCAEACEACAQSCESLPGMEQCAQACRNCAESCRQMAV